MTYRNWPLICPICQQQTSQWGWDYDFPFPCATCQVDRQLYIEPKGSAPGIKGDNIPGGMLVKHGICYPDGTPRRVDSYTELKRHLNEAGLSIKGDTPEPYRVPWSGKVTDPTGAGS